MSYEWDMVFHSKTRNNRQFSIESYSCWWVGNGKEWKSFVSLFLLHFISFLNICILHSTFYLLLRCWCCFKSQAIYLDLISIKYDWISYRLFFMREILLLEHMRQLSSCAAHSWYEQRQKTNTNEDIEQMISKAFCIKLSVNIQVDVATASATDAHLCWQRLMQSRWICWHKIIIFCDAKINWRWFVSEHRAIVDSQESVSIVALIATYRVEHWTRYSFPSITRIYWRHIVDISLAQSFLSPTLRNDLIDRRLFSSFGLLLTENISHFPIILSQSFVSI